MVKVINIIIIAFLLVSCYSKEYNKDKHDIVFVYNPFITIDFDSKVLKIDYGELEYRDILNLSKKDEAEIIRSFNRNIGDLKGDFFYYNDTLKISHSGEFKIQLFAYGKLQSQMIIDENYDNKGNLPFGQKYKIVSFRDDVLEILNKNKEFNKALKAFTKYDSNLWKSHMK